MFFYFPRIAAQTNFESEFLKGKNLYLSAQFNDAISHFKKMLSDVQSNYEGRLHYTLQADIYKYLAYSHIGLGEEEKAISEFKKMLKLNPEKKNEIPGASPKINVVFQKALSEIESEQSHDDILDFGKNNTDEMNKTQDAVRSQDSSKNIKSDPKIPQNQYFQGEKVAPEVKKSQTQYLNPNLAKSGKSKTKTNILFPEENSSQKNSSKTNKSSSDVSQNNPDIILGTKSTKKGENPNTSSVRNFLYKIKKKISSIYNKKMSQQKSESDTNPSKSKSKQEEKNTSSTKKTSKTKKKKL